MARWRDILRRKEREEAAKKEKERQQAIARKKESVGADFTRREREKIRREASTLPSDDDMSAFFQQEAFQTPLDEEAAKKAQRQAEWNKLKRLSRHAQKYAGSDKGSELFGKIKVNLFGSIVLMILAIVAGIFGFIYVATALGVAILYIYLHKRSAGKEILKLIIVFLVTWEFISPHRQYLIALAVLWIVYFSMPTSYKHEDETEYTEPDEQKEVRQRNAGNFLSAWARVIVGVFLSIVIYLAFGGSQVGGAALTPVLFMAFAFFVSPPHKTDDSGKGIEIDLVIYKHKAKSTTQSLEGFYNIIFLVLMIIALITGLVGGGWGPQATALGSTLGTAMIGFWFFALLAGWFARSSGRPAVGVAMIIIALFIFSFQFTGVVGSEMFGNYWPSVEHYGSMVVTPVYNMYSEAATGVSDAWLIMTNPAAYEQKKLEEEQAKSGKIKKGGTDKSIELVDFNALNYGSARPTIDPQRPFVGTINLENQGEFTAEYVHVNLGKSMIKDPKKVGAAYNGDYDCYSDPNVDDKTKCTYTPIYVDKCQFTSCTGSDDTMTFPIQGCSWTENPTIPGDLKLMTFKCGQYDSDGEYLNQWHQDLSGPDAGGNFTIRTCDCFPRDAEADDVYLYKGGPCNTTDGVSNKNDGCNLNDAILTYKYGGYYLTIPMAYDFTYDVDAQSEIQIMDEDVFLDRLSAKEITVREKESKYTGGPVVLSINIQAQPLRKGEESFITVAVANNDEGSVLSNMYLDWYEFFSQGTGWEDTFSPSELIVYVPEELVEPGTMNILNNIRVTRPDETNIEDGYYVLKSRLNEELGEDDFARFTFSFKGTLPEDIIEKSSLITATFNYTYAQEEKLEFPIIKIPVQ